MDDKKPSQIELTVEITVPTDLTDEQIEQLNKELKSTVVHSLSDKVSPDQVRVQDRFRIWAPSDK